MAALPTPAAGAGLAFDARSLDALKARATADPRGAVRAAAQQFEALFMAELVKSMRATTMASGLVDNEGSRLGTEMLDTQLSTRLAGLPGGLSDAIARQLERQMGLAPGPIPAAARSANDVPPPLGGAANRPVRIPQTAAAGFVQQHRHAAAAAERETGIPAAFMVAQAAHETGWGRREIRHADGSPAHNLFGIKAGPNWQGPVAEVTTTEYVGGVARKVTARFRAYASYAESFADYARLMTRSPRYREVLAHGGDATRFAEGLQRAGYATDPAYADKLGRVINTTLRLQRALG
ncbi:MAG: flagellar assembly peptidoglycan hydrolase FlgJ [Rubrivivax sp.]|nr:flagellar assembly peptidoglycan hydrolase FlgJ [Rubrivivax sp.]